MKNTKTSLAAALAAGLLSYGFSQTAQAAPVLAGNSYFGAYAVPGDFGGSGIPTNQLAVSYQSTVGGDMLTLAGGATPRFAVGNLPNDGTSEFFYTPGVQFDVDFMANITGGSGNLSDYDFSLYYGLTGTPMADMGVWNLNAGMSPTATSVVESEYLGFNFWSAGVAGAVTPPSGGFSFNPSGTASYTFVLEGSSASDPSTVLVSDQFSVAPVPEPTTLALAGLGGVGFLFLHKRRK